MTNGVEAPLTTVILRNLAASSAPAQEISVRINIIPARLWGKKAAISSANTGSLAPQFMNGAVSRVAMRSLGDRRVRVAITPGTAQPPAMPPETI